MTSYEFEKAAKNAVCEVLRNQHDLFGIALSEMQMVWFSYQLGAMKATLYCPKMGKYYAEVTYNKTANEMYVDIYHKVSNTKITRDGFDFDADKKLTDGPNGRFYDD